MGFFKDFKTFASKGNVMDLAVAVIIGAAFGAIVTSLVNDIITPLILSPALEAAHLSSIKELKWGNVAYGSFLAAILNFLVIALVIFMLIRSVASMQKKKEEAPAAPPGPSSTDKLLMEIRDELKKR
jgi:large conductance mechanosensitive channel